MVPIFLDFGSGADFPTFWLLLRLPLEAVGRDVTLAKTRALHPKSAIRDCYLDPTSM